MSNLDFIRQKGFFEGMPSGTFVSGVCTVAAFGVGGFAIMVGIPEGIALIVAPFLFAIAWNMFVNGFKIGRAKYLTLSLSETSALAYALGFLWERSGFFRMVAFVTVLTLLALGASKLIQGEPVAAAEVQVIEAYEVAGKRARTSTPPDGVRKPVLPAPVSVTTSLHV